MVKLSTSVFALVLLLTAGANTVLAQEREYINPRSAADTGVPPFSGAVRTGNTLYLSGMLGLVNGQVPDDPQEEARILLDSIKSTLEAADMTMDDLVYVQIFCSDVALYDAFNEVYRTYFTREFPARAFLGSGTLLFNARFEIQSIAVKR
ncbi:MAG: RidA family protein [Xanthomonadales bacterium]|nr:RidA family protein [Xanthomonadales bacterium]